MGTIRTKRRGNGTRRRRGRTAVTVRREVRSAHAGVRRATPATPRPKKWAKGAVKSPGALGGRGYTRKPAVTRHKLIQKSVRKVGVTRTRRRLLFLQNVTTSRPHKVAMADVKWFGKKYRRKK